MTNAVSSALSGLLAAQAQIDLVSRNIANAGTEGYTRKTRETVGDLYGGVRLLDVTRRVDEAMILAVRQSEGRLARLEVEIAALSKLELASGDPNSSTSLSGLIVGLKTAFEALAVNPNDPVSFSATLGAGYDLARAFNRLYDAAADIAATAARDLATRVEEANGYLRQIAELNRTLQTSSNGDSAAEAEDARDLALRKLSGLLDVTMFANENGSITLYSRDGKILVDGARATTLTLDGGGNLAALDASGSAVPILAREGTFAGLLEVRRSLVPDFQAKLDDIARAVTAGIEAAGVPLFNDGGTTPFDPTDPVQRQGYAQRIAVNAAIEADPTLLRGTPDSGDTSVIAAVLAFFDDPATAYTGGLGLPPSGSIIDVSAMIVAGEGNARVSAEAERDREAGIRDILDRKTAEVSGVNLDEEFASLVQLQKAYQASAKAFEIASSLFDMLEAAVRR